MRLRWLPAAADDLAGIHSYLRESRPTHADFIVRRIYEGIVALAEMPFRGRPRQLPGERDLIFSNLPYIVTYRIKHETVEIMYIRHGARKPL